MASVELVEGVFPILVIEDRSGEIHELELSRRTADELENLLCSDCDRRYFPEL